LKGDDDRILSVNTEAKASGDMPFLWTTCDKTIRCVGARGGSQDPDSIRVRTGRRSFHLPFEYGGDDDEQSTSPFYAPRNLEPDRDSWGNPI